MADGWIWALVWLAAIGGPLFFVFVRHEARLSRLQMLGQLKAAIGERDSDSRELSEQSSFEYVREKYTADLGAEFRDRHQDPMAALQNAPPWWRVGSSWKILLAAIPFILVSVLGFGLLLFEARIQDAPKVFSDLCILLLVGGEHTGADAWAHARNTLTIGAVAFVGAYLFSLNILGRAVTAFDLSTVTMMRITVNLVIAVMAAIIVFRAFPNPLAMLTEPIDGDAVTVTAASPLSPLWLVFAFAFGLIPDMAINWIVVRVQGWSGAKTTDAQLVGQTKSTSLEILDGVDLYVRFRLQQANIFEMQNLAVTNPIMLFVETPYGIYQCVDWVAQAQLCTVVGPERFLALRRFNIRTIFDLERAMLSTGTTSQFRRLVASLIMTVPPSGGPETSRPWRFRAFGLSKDEEIVGSSAFGEAMYDLLSGPANDGGGQAIAGDPERTLKHLARIIIDDLHVHRLRGVWEALRIRLGEKYAYLPDTEPEPKTV